MSLMVRSSSCAAWLVAASCARPTADDKRSCGECQVATYQLRSARAPPSVERMPDTNHARDLTHDNDRDHGLLSVAMAHRPAAGSLSRS